MQLIFVHRGETDPAPSRQYTGSTDLVLTARDCCDAASFGPRLRSVTQESKEILFLGLRRRATETIELALPDAAFAAEPLVVEFDAGVIVRLIPEAVTTSRLVWDIWRGADRRGGGVARVRRHAAVS
jgi:broad specificity phosphatase PhoE